MKKTWLVVAVVVIVGAAAAVALFQDGGEWTSDSAEAIAEFNKGLDAEMKVYYDEARLHFAKAVSLDPNFTVAKAMLAQKLAQMGDKKGTDELVEDLRTSDLAGLTPRERFLVEFRIARFGGDGEKADEINDAFVASYPNDPWGLFYAAQRAHGREDYVRADELYRRLLKVAPNWVVAYNSLGYMEMSRGNWREAERMFTTYRFIAPDHANPHDSLGELLTLTGRYGEAEREFEDAIAVRLDFCPSYGHLVQLAMLEGRPDKVDAMLYRAAESQACPSEVLESLRCNAAIGQAARAGNWSEVLTVGEQCKDRGRAATWFVQRAALMTGNVKLATTLEENVRTHLKSAESQEGAESIKFYRCWVAHMEGTRAAFEGRLEEAAASYREADALLPTRELPIGLEKLLNLADLAEVYRIEGNEHEAERVGKQIDDINPRIVESLGQATRFSRTS